MPSLALILISSFEFRQISRSKNQCIRHNKLNIIRLLTCLCLVATNLITLCTYMHSIVFAFHSQFTLSDFFAVFSKLLISVFLTVISHHHRTRGVITSGIISIVNLILVVSSTVLLFDVLAYNGHTYTDYERQNIFVNAVCVYILLFLSCFADDAVDAGLRPDSEIKKIKEKSGEKIEKEETVPTSPKKYSSFLSKITFFWCVVNFKLL